MTPFIKNTYWWVREHLSLVAFATGFLWDTLTLRRIDLVYENVVFIVYLLIALAGIFLVHAVETRVFAPKWLLKFRVWLPIIIQFPLGGLFSGFLILYTKSSSVFVSWPFLLVLVMLFVGNEFFKRRYERLIFQMSLFYFALLSYMVLVTPIITRSISTATFLYAGILSLVIIGFVLYYINKFFPKLFKQGGVRILFIVGGIYLSFNALYFTNIIPPVPLSLKEIGIYHSVSREGGSYVVTYEKPAWYESWRDTSKVFHKGPGEAAYCFTSVFLPTRFNEPLYHSWQRKATNGQWVRAAGGRIEFTTDGGRLGGYRAYSLKQNLDEGEWRCVVETESQQVIGMVRFNVLDVHESVELTDGTR